MDNFKLKTSRLDQFESAVKKMPEIYRPSKFWSDENAVHKNQIQTSDLSNFKRSVNVRYFNWRTFGILRHQMRPVYLQFLRLNFLPFLNPKFIKRKLNLPNITNFNPVASLIYKTYVASLFDFVKKFDRFNLLNSLQEPVLGNPFYIRYKDKDITQDLLNSIFEFYSVIDKTDLGLKPRIAEIGAGYGRTAFVFLKALPNCQYTIIDLPPALYIAEEYLSRVFEGEKVFKYREFDSYDQIKTEFEAAKIKFLLPSQIELIPKDAFNLSINISSLHEMSRKQIANYLIQIDRTTSGYFYSKQWRKSWQTNDNDHIRKDEYPIPSGWKKIFMRNRHPIQRMFFDALYKTR